MAKTRVFLVDDSADIRKAVRRLFHLHPDFEVVEKRCTGSMQWRGLQVSDLS
jgi:hypothetical protein